MRIYSLSPEELKGARPKTWPRFVGLAFLNTAIFYAVLRWSAVSFHHPSQLIVIALLQGIGIATISTWGMRKMLVDYHLYVDDDEMLSNTRFATNSVHRGEVRTLWERKLGLVISDRGRLGTFFLGGVWIPKALNEYDSLKGVALSWKKA